MAPPECGSVQTEADRLSLGKTLERSDWNNSKTVYSTCETALLQISRFWGSGFRPTLLFSQVQQATRREQAGDVGGRRSFSQLPGVLPLFGPLPLFLRLGVGEAPT